MHTETEQPIAQQEESGRFRNIAVSVQSARAGGIVMQKKGSCRVFVYIAQKQRDKKEKIVH